MMRRRHRLEQTFVLTLNDTNSNEQLGMRITVRLKEIKKRRALRGKQRVELLINSVGKRTVVILNPSFFYFFNPFFVIGNSNAQHNRHCKLETLWHEEKYHTT